MASSRSVFSNRTITPKGLGRLMQDLGAEVDLNSAASWRITRDGVSVVVGIGEDLEWLPVSDVKEIGDMLDDWPKSQVTFVFNATSADSLVYDLVRAIALAMAEHWPIVLDDNSGSLERVLPASQAPRKGLPRYR